MFNTKQKLDLPPPCAARLQCFERLFTRDQIHNILISDINQKFVYHRNYQIFNSVTQEILHFIDKGFNNADQHVTEEFTNNFITQQSLSLMSSNPRATLNCFKVPSLLSPEWNWIAKLPAIEKFFTPRSISPFPAIPFKPPMAPRSIPKLLISRSYFVFKLIYRKLKWNPNLNCNRAKVSSSRSKLFSPSRNRSSTWRRILQSDSIVVSIWKSCRYGKRYPSVSNLKVSKTKGASGGRFQSGKPHGICSRKLRIRSRITSTGAPIETDKTLANNKATAASFILYWT